jgi:hypothetical protein
MPVFAVVIVAVVLVKVSLTGAYARSWEDA